MMLQRNRFVRLIAAVTVAVGLLTHALACEPVPIHSQLWGERGEHWTPESRLPDFSYAGYHRGERDLPSPNVDMSVKDFGAVGDGKTDDTRAFQTAIREAAGKTIAIPSETYVISDIDLGEGTRMFQSGGGSALGRHSAAWETFWCIRSRHPQTWPAGCGPDLMNIVGVNSDQATQVTASGRWFEPIAPQRLQPQNLYQAQLDARLKHHTNSVEPE